MSIRAGDPSLIFVCGGPVHTGPLYLFKRHGWLAWEGNNT